MSKPRVLWSAPSATVTYEASLRSKHPRVRQTLLDGDWYFSEEPKRKRRRQRPPKRNKLTPAARKRPRKPPGR